MNELVVMENGAPALEFSTADKLIMLEESIQRMQDARDKLRAAIMEEMEAKGIVKIEMPELCATYIAPTMRESFNSKKFRQAHPEMYDEYTSINPVKASVRIKIGTKAQA